MNRTSRQNNAEQPDTALDQLLQPFSEFLAHQSASSILLVSTAIISLLLANSSMGPMYFSTLETSVMLGVQNGWAMEMTLRDWISSGLMTFFFFLIGLEIKRELLAGELRQMRQAVPVISAAIGGMLIPAALFISLAGQEASASRGWAIPMATDAAFALGILSMLGGRVPRALLVFVAALAIIDDIGAVLIIAIFYSAQIHVPSLGIALFFLAALALFTYLGGRSGWVYLLAGTLIWYFVHHAGIHATVAGVMVAAVVPSRAFIAGRALERHVRKLLRQHRTTRKEQHGDRVLENHSRHALVQSISQAARLSTTPLQRWEHGLESPVFFVIMPVFALASAGIPISWNSLQSAVQEPLAMGIAAGLLAGKCIGVTAFTWAATSLGLGTMPKGCSLGHIVGVGLLAGIGFTMSIFVTTLAYGADSALYNTALTAVLLSSAVAGTAGFMWLRFICPSKG